MKFDRKNITFGEWTMFWLEHIGPRTHKGSVKRYSVLYRGIIAPVMMHWIMYRIEPEDVQMALIEISRNRKYQREDASVEMMFGFVKAVLHDAYAYAKLTKMDLSTGLSSHRRVSNTAVPLSKEEIKKLLNLPDDITVKKHYLIFIRFILMTGAKLSEARSVRLEEYNPEKKIVAVNGRSVYYPNILERWMQEWLILREQWRQKSGKEWPASNWLFAEPDGGQIILSSFYYHMKKIMKYIGRQDCTTECLRHTAIMVSTVYSREYSYEAVLVAQYGEGPFQNNNWWM